MVILPTKGITASSTIHRSDINIVSDWIEITVICSDDAVSRVEIIDRLIEEEIYNDQNFAAEFVSIVWNEIKRRSKLCGASYLLEIDSEWIRSTSTWEAKPEHLFCLVLSLSTDYDWWTKDFGSDYTEQGLLFEKLTMESLRTTSIGWKVELTGWSKTKAERLKDIVTQVSEIIGDGPVDFKYWDPNIGGDLGLDLLLYRPFPDNRKGFPYMLIQCASGANWDEKLSTPNLHIWEHLINPITTPLKGFAMPFCLSESEFHKSCVDNCGMFLDRCRLLEAGRIKEEWLSEETKLEIIAWLQPRLKNLLERSK